MKKACEWCKEEFETKRKDRKTCSVNCRQAKSYAKNLDKSRARQRSRRSYFRNWIAAHSERNRESCHGYYDNKGCLVEKQKSDARMARIKQDPLRYAALRKRQREANKRYYARKKLEVQRAAYLADPINAARIAEANYLRMSPEEKERWHQKIEAEQEKADRKARREALKKELAAVTATENITQDPTWSGLDWSK